MNKTLEQEIGYDLKYRELTDAYEQDLRTIQKCQDQLEIAKNQRTYEYEQEIIKCRREYGK